MGEERTIFHLWCKADLQESPHFRITIERRDQTEEQYKDQIYLFARFNAVCT